MAIKQLTPITSRGYARPDVLVDCEWVAAHQIDSKVRLLESNEDLLLYDTGHIAGAVKIDWVNDLNDAIVRDYVDRGRFQGLLRDRGIDDDTTLVFYGDKNNWWACYAFWVFQLFGVRRCKLLDGGRARWIDEGRPLTTELPVVRRGTISVGERNDAPIRAFRDDVVRHVAAKHPLVDVRSPEEYRGEKLHMPDYPNEGALRGGHIPGAHSVPWSRAVDAETHTFRTAEELRHLYHDEEGVDAGDDVIVYCRIGERSSHTWFVLTYLLGWPTVRNYDGSWTEWGNTVRAPIERP
ncbi:MAG TPA: sulfurtransferase [Gemmatimonadales bacterium]|jgi:thiosulfate/3-mercaptopyruvate sulfurtransferase